MENYRTKAEAIIALQNQGYELDFILENGNLVCIQDQELVAPGEFEIREVHRFRNKVKRGETYFIYAINSAHNGLKGILMATYNAFGQSFSTSQLA